MTHRTGWIYWTMVGLAAASIGINIPNADIHSVGTIIWILACVIWMDTAMRATKRADTREKELRTARFTND